MQRHEFVTGAVILVAIVLIIAGIYIGEPADVLQKAVNICLECIGVG